MEKRMQEVIVKTQGEDIIELHQPCAMEGDDFGKLWIHADQVDTLIAWLKEARDELQTKSSH